MKLAAAIWAAVLCLGASGAERVTLPAGTLRFASPDQPVCEATALENEVALTPLEETEGWLSLRPVSPLMRRERLFRFRDAHGDFYATPALSLQTPPDAPTDYARTAGWERLPLALLAALLGAFFLLWRGRRVKFNSKVTAIFAFFALVLMRQYAALSAISWTGNFICAPTDDLGYWEAARNLLAGDLHSRLSFTIGNGLFYIPLIVILKAKSYYDFAETHSYFSALVFSPLAIGFTFLFFRRISGSFWAAFAAGVILVFQPLLCHWMPTDDAQTAVFTFYGLPGVGGSFSNYNIFTAIGFNTMSDTPAWMLTMLLFLLAAELPLNWWGAAVMGGIFGLACLVRINSILYLPGICLVWLLRDGERWSWRTPVSGAAALAAFAATFGIQLYLNKIQHGGLLTFPYVMHPTNAIEGFRLRYVAGNAAYLFNGNREWWSLGCAALWWQREVKLRTVLAWSGIPALLFFCGYPCTTFDAVRFILPAQGALIMAITSTMAKSWKLFAATVVTAVAIWVLNYPVALAAAILPQLRAVVDAVVLLARRK